MGVVHKLFDEVSALGTSAVIYPQALRDQQGYVQIVKDTFLGLTQTFDLLVEARLDESVVAPWTRLVSFDELNTNTFGNSVWFADPVSGLETMLSIAIPILPVMRLRISTAVSGGGAHTISAYLVE